VSKPIYGISLLAVIQNDLGSKLFTIGIVAFDEKNCENRKINNKEIS
tara:strand:+ start:707 stop:847 length:141 start_codon:yes stop_codon:yes gene_type:complete